MVLFLSVNNFIVRIVCLKVNILSVNSYEFNRGQRYYKMLYMQKYLQ